MSELIEVLSQASDKYGSPYLVGFMDEYQLSGLKDATEEQIKEYIRNVGLDAPRKEVTNEKCVVF